MLFKQKSKHIGSIVISIVLISLISSLFFLSSSIKSSLKDTIKEQPDFVVSKSTIDKVMDSEYIDKIASIRGVESINARVYGRYYFNNKGKSALIVGIDPFEESNAKYLRVLFNDIDIEKFLSKDYMIVSSSVDNYLKSHFFKDSYTFKLPSGDFKRVGIYRVLPTKTNLIANDMIILPIDIAREILGIDDDGVTSISFDVANDAEWSNVKSLLYGSFIDINVVDKKEIISYYDEMFAYKQGLFLLLYIISLVTFMMILYQRYSSVYSVEKRDIGILRALGWSIKDILRLKLSESFIVAMSSFIIGVVIAYIYVFIFDAPLLKYIFFGMDNLSVEIELKPYIDIGMLVSLWLIYTIPFISAIIIPSWRVATTSAKEAMK
jgi:ABC-type lipoprotein release transport system permease subunit